MNSTQSEEPAWLILAKKKRKWRDEAIENYLHQRKLASDDVITSISDVASLANAVAAGEWSATEVVHAYIRR
jgi:hypothetical protein